MSSTSSQKSIDRSNFLQLRNSETERDTSEKHESKSLDLQNILQFDDSFFCSISFRSKVTEV